MWDSIDFVNTADPTLNLWLASSENSGEPFVVVDGSSVTASAMFVDMRTNDLEGIGGTLEATCP